MSEINRVIDSLQKVLCTATSTVSDANVANNDYFKTNNVIYKDTVYNKCTDPAYIDECRNLQTEFPCGVYEMTHGVIDLKKGSNCQGPSGM